MSYDSTSSGTGDWLSIRDVPEIILGGTFFFQTPPPPGHTWSQSPPPRPPGHVSALINLPHHGSNTPWPPGQVTSPPHPTPRTHCQQNTLHPQDKKVFAAPPPQGRRESVPDKDTPTCAVVNHCGVVEESGQQKLQHFHEGVEVFLDSHHEVAFLNGSLGLIQGLLSVFWLPVDGRSKFQCDFSAWESRLYS